MTDNTVTVRQTHAIVSVEQVRGPNISVCTCQLWDEDAEIEHGRVFSVGNFDEDCPHK